jgi:glutamine amidotransferase
MSTVVLIDYGSGNLRSAEKALARAAAERDRQVVVSAEPEVIEPKHHELKVPHMGWNALTKARPHPITAGVLDGGHMYFTHSFILDARDETDVIAWTEHGDRFVAAVARDNVAGMQFHPEKSQANGIRLLGDFLEWRP